MKEGDLGTVEYVRTNDAEDVGTYEGVLSATFTENNNYEVTIEKGNFIIEKRSVTIESGSATKPYDGTALTNHTATVTEGNFVAGDEPSYKFTGSQTEVGSSYNTFTVEFKDSSVVKAMGEDIKALAIADNYDIKLVYGTLTVTAAAPADNTDTDTDTGNGNDNEKSSSETKTGDNFSLLGTLTGMTAALLGLLGLAITRRKEEDQ